MWHSSPLEDVFFGISICVTATSIWLLRQAQLDLTSLVARKQDGPRRATAEGNIQECWFNFSGALIMLGASTMALLLEPPPPEYAQLPQSLVFLVAWIMLGLLIVASGLLSKSRRRKLMEMSPVEHTETTSVTAPPDQGGKP